jgi:DnaD/phage-associated family protein
VAGWIKLWRKLKENGHLKMPGTAFKLWIYCLLEAAPYYDRSRSLETGELWLNYEHVRQVIGEAGRQMSKSTVSSALKYLEQHSYVQLEAKRFYGVKVRVANWREYQPGTETVPTRVQKSYPPGTKTVLEGKPVAARPDDLPGTEIVPAARSPGTVTSTETVPVPVLVRASEANSGRPSGAPKNNKNKDIVVVDVVVVADIAAEFAREFGRPLSPLEIKQLVSWRKEFSPELISEALTCAVLQDKRTAAYIGGILKNWRRAGVATVEEARREQDKPDAKGGKKNARTKPGYRPSEVDWASEPDTL